MFRVNVSIVVATLMTVTAGCSSWGRVSSHGIATIAVTDS